MWKAGHMAAALLSPFTFTHAPKYAIREDFLWVEKDGSPYVVSFLSYLLLPVDSMPYHRNLLDRDIRLRTL